jgi:hypothetical protein
MSVASLAVSGERAWGDSSQSNSDEEKRRGAPYNNVLSLCGVTPIMYKAKPRTLQRYPRRSGEVHHDVCRSAWYTYITMGKVITVRVKERVIVVSV